MALSSSAQYVDEPQMPRIVLFVPFEDLSTVDEVIVANMHALEMGRISLVLGGRHYDEAVVVTLETEDFRFEAGDVLVVNAHGSPRSTHLYSASSGGETTTMKVAIGKLEGWRASLVDSAWFAICFSALKGHIAHRFHASFPAPAVLGTTDLFEGSLWAWNPPRMARKEGSAPSLVRNWFFSRRKLDLLYPGMERGDDAGPSGGSSASSSASSSAAAGGGGGGSR